MEKKTTAKGRKTVHVSFNIPVSDARKLIKLIKATGLTRSETMRRALREHIAFEERKAATNQWVSNWRS